jgi:radical SAM protein with 4Fe4S-binding SPASM domain
MNTSFLAQSSLPEFALWEKTQNKRVPFSFYVEVTARCNNDCRHCFINLPAGDREAQARELSVEAIGDIADQAVALGAVWCVITGGEPLLRPDFADLYMLLKRKGLLVSLFTNACLVTEEHVKLLKRYPPRDIEVTVYGASAQTYEQVSRRPGSYAAFVRGLDLLMQSDIKVRLKAMALRSNMHELAEMGRFCRERTRDYYRFDPLLHLRYDGNPRRNVEIRAERLSASEIVAIEQADEERINALARGCHDLTELVSAHHNCDHLFHCGTGNSSFVVGYDGRLRPCASLWHPDCIYDLEKGSLADAWNRFIPQVRDLRSADLEFLSKCRVCPLMNLCLWCPAHAYLESGRMDAWCEHFCDVAHARADAIRQQANDVHAGLPLP